MAFIDEERCIGCTKCLPPCPVDAIVGAPRRMHTVIAELCTGCELCVAPCPVDCIVMIPLLASPLPRSRCRRPRTAARASTAHNERIARRAAERAAMLADKKRGARPAMNRAMNPPSAAKSSNASAPRIRIPTTELEYRAPFELLVAVILSAQATDKSVNAVTRKLFPVARTPRGHRRTSASTDLSKYIRTIGLWKAKAKNVIATASAIADEHGGEVPRNREALEALAGSGTQNCERGPEHNFRRADNSRRHAHLPRRQPHENRAGRNAARSGRRVAQVHARGIRA